MSELSAKRVQFGRMMARLLLEAERLGLQVAPDDVRRKPTCSHGHPKSLHRLGLAVDLVGWDAAGNAYANGTDVDFFRPLGEWWKKQGGAWGGDFRTPDAPHFSLPHGGML